jgi:acyl-CoA thioesterase
VELLGLEFDAAYHRVRFELVPQVARHDGALYGGTSIAVSVAAMEAATSRGVLWITTQYVANARLGDITECTVEVLASGRNIAQVQVTGRLGRDVLFVSVGSTALPRAGGLEGQYRSMPAVSRPEDEAAMTFGFARPTDIPGFTEQVEYRSAQTLSPADSAPSMALWARLSQDRPFTPAGIAFVADMVPPAIARAAGLLGGGISLDNNLRFAPIPDATTWVLLELHGDMSSGAHGHGSVRVWTPDGVLLAVGGQSTNMVHAYTQEQVDRMLAAGATGQ